MSLRLILGRAGAGKTHHCLEAVAREEAARPAGPPLILLVPEQATFQMEQALLAAVHRHGRRGFARARVASFQRLAWWVQQEAGGAATPTVTELGKRLILRALVAREAPRLALFGQVADRPGFIERLVATLGELAAYGIDADALRARHAALVGEGREGLLAVKLHDLALILEAYQDFLAEHHLHDPVQVLERVARCIHDAAWLQGARVWVDGFTGFTPGELRVLEALLRVADRVEVSLCLDPQEAPWAVGGAGQVGRGDDESALFHPTAVTARQLLDIARRAGVAVAPARVLPEAGGGMPRFRNPALAHLERELFQFPGRRFAGPPEGITLVAAPDRRAEVAAAAREMLRLAREEGYRFRDMVVIVRDLETYHDLLATACAEHGIPLFVDRRRPVAHHPLLELVRAALEVVAGDWPYEAVFRYLKTDLVPVPRGEVDRLENYVLAFGIRGSRWYRGGPWRWWRHEALEADVEPTPVQQAELEAINRIRDEATGHLRRFFQRVAPARRQPVPAADLAAALYQLLVDLDVPARLQGWSEEAEGAGDLEAAQEHLQVWNGVAELLEQVGASLPGIALTAAEFLRVLEAGMEGLRVGLIPPGLDQVVAGSVERSRHPSARAAFVLGATDDAFPRRVEEDAIFTDQERDELAERGVELGPPGRVRALHEQYHTYVALTRARDRLWVSYPLGDEEGRAVAPAWLTRRLRVLLPGLAVSSATADGTDDVATPAQGIDRLARLLARHRDAMGVSAGPWAPPAPRRGDPPPTWAVLYQWAVTDPAVRPRALRSLAALAHANRPRPLGRELGRQLYARPAAAGWLLRTSVSRLERFAACPFQHFAAHGLGLRERVVGRLDAPRLGRIHHAALSLLARKVWEEGLDWKDLDDSRLEAMVAACLDEIGPRLAQELAVETAYHAHLLERTRRILGQTARRLAEHARRGDFRPLAVEVDFGPDPDAPLQVEPWRLPSGERLALQGRIDRIDGARTASGRWLVRVVDYKSSAHDLPLDQVYHGLALQLPLYLLVAVRAGAALGIDPGGAPGRPGAGSPVPAPDGGPPGSPVPAAAVEPAALLYFPVHDPFLDTEGPLPAEEAARRRARRLLRAQGWVVDDAEVIRAHDRELKPETLIPVELRRDGTPTAWARVLQPGEMADLFRLVEARVQAMATAILAGRVEVAPYRLKERSPCGTCAFRALCQFDPRLPGNRYRVMRPLRPQEVWQRVRQAHAPDGGGGASTGLSAGRAAPRPPDRPAPADADGSHGGGPAGPVPAAAEGGADDDRR
ncbi:PD-(D/E)XK nuclease family protein [Thermaerobacter composti]|uniref:PD-(D/E)XK nuclease family protein n=1 Tax=Thermaerobacter composti TaxID=554949 RepID=A0ABZ0QSZ3_9FIRM|nr:PD-(D/E)XK nuclease family protein [Thermaerobacter composti]WPD19792.1 PD-(D/E)XK nuclease family protein [Thermaerobacter composti]